MTTYFSTLKSDADQSDSGNESTYLSKESDDTPFTLSSIRGDFCLEIPVRALDKFLPNCSCASCHAHVRPPRVKDT